MANENYETEQDRELDWEAAWAEHKRNEELRSGIIHNLRMKGWDRIDAENRADEIIAQKQKGA